MQISKLLLWLSAAVLAVLALASVTELEAQGPRAEKATVHLVEDRTAYEPGSEGRIAVVMTIESGWHVNSHEPTYDYLIGTEAVFTLPGGWQPVTVEYPRGEMSTFAFADEPLSVYEGEVSIVGTFRVPDDAQAGSATVQAAVTYQACNDRSCLPPVTSTQAIDITIGSGGQDTGYGAFPVSDASAPQADRSSANRPAPNLGLILLLGLVGGLILNAMPCVLPVLSLKIFGLVKSAGQGRSYVVIGALATSAGILISFWALAAAAVVARSLGSTVGWGVQFQEPTFVAFLAVVVLLFCLNLWGLFEISLPTRLAQVGGSGPREGVPGHLFSGLFATLMATPCSAPFLGTAVGFGLSQSAGTIFAVFTAIALGMALPYLILAAAPGAARWLPKPGEWMEKLRGLMGFLLAAAAVWLFYVLAAQVSTARLAFIELSLLGLAMFVWMRHSATRRRWARIVALAGILATIASTIGLAATSQRISSGQVSEASTGLLDWLTFDEIEAKRLVREDGRIVFVDVTADWCFTCKVNERLVLETPEVAEVFERRQVIAMKADWTNRSDVIAEYLASHGRYGVPFYMLYRPGTEPHLFSELLDKDELIELVEEVAAGG